MRILSLMFLPLKSSLFAFFEHFTTWVIFFLIKNFWVSLKISPFIQKMSPTNFPLRWESTGDKWWYASPIDWAAANGHYDLVRELLRLDGNHLIKLTSLRRVRRLEAVWDDEEQFHDVAKCRCEVAHKLFDECQAEKEGKNSLIVAGYGGWLLYTAASAGDAGFVQELLGINPLLVFGDGEYGLTDILYAAARSKNLEVFRVIYDFALSPRFVTGRGNAGQQVMEVVPLDFKLEVKNRAVHAAARGGHLMGLKELLTDCNDVLEYRDAHGSTVLHAAAGKGQVEVVNCLIASHDMISSTDNEGNTPLHIAAYRGHLSVLKALIQSFPSSAPVVNKAGNTFLHMAVAGFHTPGFRRLDQQIELIKQLLSSKCFNIGNIINSQNSEGRTALHLAVMGNVQSNLVELLLNARNIRVNICDNHGMTPLDYLNRQPQSPSSDMLIRQLVSVGGLSSCKDYAVRKAFASHVRMHSICSSPGAFFRALDNEILQSTGIDRLLNSGLDKVSAGHFRSLSEATQFESGNGDNSPFAIKKSGTLHSASKRLKTMLHWPQIKRKETERRTSEEAPIPLRERFSNSTALLSNRRTLAVRSNMSSPTNRKKFASGVAFGILQDQKLVNIPSQGQSLAGSFPRSSVSSYNSVDKGKGVRVEDQTAKSSCLKYMNDDNAPNVIRKLGSIDKRFVNPSLWFRGHHVSLKNPIGKHSMKQAVYSAA